MASLGAGPAQHIHTLTNLTSCRSKQAAATAAIGSGTQGVGHKYTCHKALHMLECSPEGSGATAQVTGF